MRPRTLLHYLWHANTMKTANAVFLIYDAILTMADEVHLIWRRRLNAASTIFILNRIGAILLLLWLVLQDTDGVSWYLMCMHSSSHDSSRCE